MVIRMERIPRARVMIVAREALCVQLSAWLGDVRWQAEQKMVQNLAAPAPADGAAAPADNYVRPRLPATLTALARMRPSHTAPVVCMQPPLDRQSDPRSPTTAVRPRTPRAPLPMRPRMPASPLRGVWVWCMFKLRPSGSATTMGEEGGFRKFGGVHG